MVYSVETRGSTSIVITEVRSSLAQALDLEFLVSIKSLSDTTVLALVFIRLIGSIN